MGASYSQVDYAGSALSVYEDILHQPCFLPDIGIDESLLKYSGSDSNAVLQAYSNEMLNKVPGYVSSLGSALGNLNSVPNAVGLGALVISLIIDLLKPNTQTNDHTYNLIRRVFGEEKASSVRDTMSEYLKRYKIFINNTKELQKETSRLEKDLSKDLTKLRNSLVMDGQMSSRGFKTWVNGAAFHVQMLIHDARLQACKPGSHCVNQIKATIDVYSDFLGDLLEKYKTYKIDSDVFIRDSGWVRFFSSHAEIDTPYYSCKMYNIEIEGCRRDVVKTSLCDYGKEVTAALMDIIYSNYELIKGLKSYFSITQNNLNSLIRQNYSFNLLPAAG